VPSNRKRDLPTRAEILEFVEGADGKVGKREIARAFGVSGPERVALKSLLREMAGDGLIAGDRRRLGKPGELPSVVVAEVDVIDNDGMPTARPATWEASGPPPRITISTRSGHQGAPGIGDRVLVKVKRRGKDRYDGNVIRVLDAQPKRVIGVYARLPGGISGCVRPSDRRQKSEIFIADSDAMTAAVGDLVVVETKGTRRMGLPQGRVVESLGPFGGPQGISTLVIANHNLPHDFPAAAIAQANDAKPVSLGTREDLRALPLVTIDDDDARDYDDAVFAKPDPDPANVGGWRLVVAIADVAHYVRPDDALDRETRKRGNSVYLPDMVVPMLPQALSSDLCSLLPKAQRACIACHMTVDAEGKMLSHRFARGLMRSAARLTYRGLQEDADGDVLDESGAALYGTFHALRAARKQRGSLDFDMPERRVYLDDDSNVTAIKTRPRYDSHRLVEEFMIAANVAAATTLIAHRAPCMFRIHDQPPHDKLETLREFLNGIGYKLPRGRRLVPKQFGKLLEQAAGKPEAETVTMAVLRSQSQAEYSPDNIGHFGLHLERYAHFTSPIRRYADLLVHRALISALGLGAGGLPKGAASEMAEIGEAISNTERRATVAERDAIDRFATRFLAERVGTSFPARVSGVTRFGLFVELADTGAQGLIPMRDFPEYMDHDEPHQRLVGSRSGKAIQLGDTLEVTLAEADALTGSLRFSLDGGIEERPKPKKGPQRRRRKK
jgi:ribonuclease R|tara:strand:- start:1726 stop:3906 length:2181 start_codon:yes stop_codon:yes gene_type:complete